MLETGSCFHTQHVSTCNIECISITFFATLYFNPRIIAEGVPESQTRAFNKVAIDKGVGIIGPATVGGIKVRRIYQL